MFEGELRWGWDVRKAPSRMWSFGICLSRCEEEIYLYINFGRYSLSIGRLKFYDEVDYDE